jgi:hypothetical protein
MKGGNMTGVNYECVTCFPQIWSRCVFALIEFTLTHTHVIPWDGLSILEQLMTIKLSMKKRMQYETWNKIQCNSREFLFAGESNFRWLMS